MPSKQEKTGESFTEFEIGTQIAVLFVCDEKEGLRERLKKSLLDGGVCIGGELNNFDDRGIFRRHLAQSRPQAIFISTTLSEREENYQSKFERLGAYIQKTKGKLEKEDLVDSLIVVKADGLKIGDRERLLLIGADYLVDSQIPSRVLPNFLTAIVLDERIEARYKGLIYQLKSKSSG